jgi:uncharacterized membrane protein YoaK (UPF0700 family)
MTNLDRNSIYLAVALSSLAGYVDSIGFLSTKGFFVSFMSGNSTRLGVGLGNPNVQNALTAFGVIVCFVMGVIGGTLVAQRSTKRKRSRVLLVVSGLLAIATTSWSLHIPHLGTIAMAMAMGAENAVFQQNGETSIGLTYMTGALVKCGQRIAAILYGAPKWDWVPYALLWVGLVTGACLGAWTHSLIGPSGLVYAVIWSLALAIVSGQKSFQESSNKSVAS